MVLGRSVRVVNVNGEIGVGPRGVQSRTQSNFRVRDIFDLAGDFLAALRKFLFELRDERFGTLCIHRFERRARVIRHRISDHGNGRKNGEQNDEQQFCAEAHGLASILNEMAEEMDAKARRAPFFCGEYGTLSEMIPRL